MRWRRLTFTDAPPIFGNAKPKSGSHLLLQILDGITQIMPYKYVQAEPIRTIRRDGGRKPGDEILAELRRIPRGVIGWGYLEATPGNVEFLCRPDRVNYFIYRDPRDLLVSQVFFATEMHAGHAMHEHYKALSDFGERLKVAIAGVDRNGLRMVSVKQRYDGVFQWLEQSQVLCVRFEELVMNRQATLAAMIDHVKQTGYEMPTPRDQALASLVGAITPEKSRTFRSGQPGVWRQFFADEHRRLFKDVAGDLIVRLGYEKTNDW